MASGGSLSQAEAAAAMEEIMSGEATPSQIAAFVVGLRFKGESVDEIAGLARVMRLRAVHVATPHQVVDTCGTGGDGSGSINVSTIAAFLVAGAGGRVAKHGNRAMSSLSGSADVLEALGVKLDVGPEGVARCIDEVGIGFMFAQAYHPAMRHAAAPRREIGIRTVFNILGPLTNPARARHQLVGVGDPTLVSKMAGALAALGSRHALVVHGGDGLDEISISGPTRVAEVADGTIREYEICPEDVGLNQAPKGSIAGGTPDENARVARRVLDGEPGPRRDVVLMNAGAALLAADLVPDLKAGVERAAESIDSGAALRKLDHLIRLSGELVK
ncbi:MAG TPA: anthranilate phosphoribosyltransferase [Chloroflexota bacterium]